MSNNKNNKQSKVKKANSNSWFSVYKRNKVRLGWAWFYNITVCFSVILLSRAAYWCVHDSFSGIFSGFFVYVTYVVSAFLMLASLVMLTLPLLSYFETWLDSSAQNGSSILCPICKLSFLYAVLSIPLLHMFEFRDAIGNLSYIFSKSTLMPMAVVFLVILPFLAYYVTKRKPAGAGGFCIIKESDKVGSLHLDSKTNTSSKEGSSKSSDYKTMPNKIRRLVDEQENAHYEEITLISHLITHKMVDSIKKEFNGSNWECKIFKKGLSRFAKHRNVILASLAFGVSVKLREVIEIRLIRKAKQNKQSTEIKEEIVVFNE